MDAANTAQAMVWRHSTFSSAARAIRAPDAATAKARPARCVAPFKRSPSYMLSLPRAQA